MDCLSTLLNHLCLSNYENAMTSLNSNDWCIWSNVSGLYSNLSQCTEEISDCLVIPWPNPLVEQTFLDIHSRFFKDCPSEELSDPPPVIIFALVITPICLIPVMVSLVVLKTKNGDGSSWKSWISTLLTISCFWLALSLLSQPEDYSLFTYTPQLRFHLTSDLAEDWIFLISLPSQFRGILRYQAQGKPIKKMTLWQNLGYYKFLYHTVTKVLFSTTPLYYVTFSLHTLFRKQSLFFFLFTGEPSIQGYDDKSSGACRSEVEMYLCWLSSWCQTAVALIKDNVIFFYWTPELFLCNFSSCCHSNITLLWATMYSMFAEEP